MILWNALWEVPSGKTISITQPIIRIIIRIIITGKTKGAFPGMTDIDDIDWTMFLIDTDNTSDTDDSENGNTWVIRRKPSNPDRLKTKSFIQYVFGY